MFLLFFFFYAYTFKQGSVPFYSPLSSRIHRRKANRRSGVRLLYSLEMLLFVVSFSVCLSVFFSDRKQLLRFNLFGFFIYFISSQDNCRIFYITSSTLCTFKLYCREGTSTDQRLTKTIAITIAITNRILISNGGPRGGEVVVVVVVVGSGGF